MAAAKLLAAALPHALRVVGRALIGGALIVLVDAALLDEALAEQLRLALFALF